MKVSKRRSSYRAILYSKSYYLVLCIAFICVCVRVVHTREFRSLNLIPTPGKLLPEGATAVAKIQPVDRNIVEKAVNNIVGAWNTPRMEDTLAEDFFDKSRLVDAIEDIEKVPRDTRLRILSIQGIQTLSQQIQTDASDVEWVESIVSATVKTQTEFNDAAEGFQRLEGDNELIIRIKQRKM